MNCTYISIKNDEFEKQFKLNFGFETNSVKALASCPAFKIMGFDKFNINDISIITKEEFNS